MSSIWSCEALRTLAEGQESRFSLHQQVLFRRGWQNRRFWLQQNCRFFSSGWGSTALRSISLDCFKDPATVRLEKHPFCHHSNFISRGVIPDKFQTGANQNSSSENGLYTCYDSYFAASLLKSKQDNQTFLNRDFSLFPRTVWS